jgi:hypothetical protein
MARMIASPGASMWPPISEQVTSGVSERSCRGSGCAGPRDAERTAYCPQGQVPPFIDVLIIGQEMSFSEKAGL